MKILSFLNKVWLCLCLIFGLFLSSCAAVRAGGDDGKGSGLWSLVISVEGNGDGELLARLTDLDDLRLVDTGVVGSGADVSGMVLLSPSYERLSAIRSDLLASGSYRVKLSRVEK